MVKVKDINIGESFSTWKVISIVDPKKYKYLCRCSCGNEKVFNKYVLRKGLYGLCKSCNPSVTRNLNKIKIHWNSELNKTPFTKPQDFNVSKQYWFICENNHNFKSNLRDFSLDKCCSCRDKVKSSNEKIVFFKALTELFLELGIEIIIDEYNIKIPNLKALIVITDEDRDSSFKKYYKNELEYLKALEKQDSMVEQSIKESYTIFKIFIVDDYKKNIDTLGKLMLKLSY